MQFQRTFTTAAIAGVLTAGAAMTTAATSSAATRPGASSAPATSARATGHVTLTALVTGRGRHAHVVVRERGATAGGGPWLGVYSLMLDGHLIDSGLASASCPKKPMRSFDTTRTPAPIHLVAGHHVIKIVQDYCKTPGAKEYSSTTHTVGFTAR